MFFFVFNHPIQADRDYYLTYLESRILHFLLFNHNFSQVLILRAIEKKNNVFFVFNHPIFFLILVHKLEDLRGHIVVPVMSHKVDDFCVVFSGA